MRNIDKKLTILVLIAVSLSSQAQKVTFVSKEFETGVKAHLGLSDTDDVLQSQTDTITTIDLSGLEIIDISDVTYLTNLVRINLGNNKIEDVSPLASLEHLEYANLRRNALESINSLIFACTDNLHINVADNYIQDFSYLFSATSCQLLLEGMGAQKQVKDPPYFNVYQLYTYISTTGVLEICYRGFTNMKNDVNITYGSLIFPAIIDGYTNSVSLTEEPIETTRVILSNGDKSEETYVVPSAIYAVGAGKTAILETGLPDDYYIYSAYALKGSVEIDGNRMKYTAPAKAVSDIVVFSYYHGATLKGFSRYSVNLGKKGDVNISGILDVQDATLTVNYILGNSSDEYDYIVADMNNDGEVDVFDVTAIINAILGEDGNPAAARRLAGQEENRESIHLNASESGLLFGIDRADRFTSFQFDIEVPDGTELLGVEWIGDIGHALQFARNGENRYRAVALSLSSAALPVTDGALLRLRLSDSPDGEIRVGNVLFVTPDGKAARFSDGTLSMTNGIQGATLNEKGEMKDEKWYDLQGRQLNKKRGQLRKGVYIINNKQVMIK